MAGIRLRQVNKEDFSKYFPSKDFLDNFIPSLLGNGIDIVANSNLNTTEFLKIGNYVCRYDDIVSTLTNCPVESAFKLEVSNPINTDYDNENDTRSVYRLRKIITFEGEIFLQNIFSTSSNGLSYSDWYRIYTEKNKPTIDEIGAASKNHNHDEVYLKSITKTMVINALGYTPQNEATKIVIDTDLNVASTNPVQNKVIANKISNIDNTSDINKPVSTAQQKAIDLAYENSNKYTDQKIADLIGGASETMDTLKEVEDAIAEHKNVETALNSAIGKKADQTELDTHTGNDTIHIVADERTNWNDANSKKHTHSNKTVLDGITSALVTAWNKVTDKLDKTGDASNVTNTITEATSRTNLSTGEKLSISLGKIKKYFSDLKTVAFSGSYNDLTNKPSIPSVGNGTVTITQNGTTKGSFTMNQSGNATIALTDTTDSVTTITKTLTIGTDWMDTGITGTDLSSGSYMVQISGMSSSDTTLYNEIFTGVMSWYSGTTNSSDSDEILLHKAGYATNGATLYLKTTRVSGGNYLKLQIASNRSNSSSSYTFKFRKLI